ncbi:helix-turn-helix domain-containing protein [Celerinatantimonas yamalensis]|uniref:Helix-turn-helix transcriptional regulator n=1 Tax=Celerinatantimonas yamalensis TaxID=559956 RepID=A0ABW9G7F6_9GAMM
MQHDHWQLIGAFLRRKRESLTPEIVGLTKPARMRTPGLRREDVAAIAGISTVWYSKIERGKVTGISQDALTRLADALALSTTERQYIRSLLTKEPRDEREPCRHISRQSQRLLSQLNPLPALFINDYFDIVDSNRAFHLMCGVDLSQLELNDRNYIYLTITNATWQQFLPVSDEQSLYNRLLVMAGLLRGFWATRTHDCVLQKRVKRFQELSPLFARAWASLAMHPVEQLEFEFRHAQLGRLTLTKQIWSSYSGETSGRLNVYHPHTERDYQLLSALMDASSKADI